MTRAGSAVSCGLKLLSTMSSVPFSYFLWVSHCPSVIPERLISLSVAKCSSSSL